MRRLGSWCVLLGVLLAAGAPALAQDGERPEGEQQGEGERRGPGGFGGGDWGGRAAEFLKDELDLDEEQAKQVGAIFQNVMGDVMKRMADSWGSEGFDQERARSVMEDVRVELSAKVREVLTEAQAREFDALVDQFDRRAQGWEQRARAYEDPTLVFEPPPISKRILLAKAERALFLGPKETAVVMVIVEDVLDKQIALTEGRLTRRKDLRHAVDGGADPKEVAQRLGEIRAGEQFLRLEYLGAQERLREVLSLEQEVRFVAMGILE